jgi:hypothetical protein
MAKLISVQIAEERKKFFEVRREFFKLLIHSDSAQIVKGLQKEKSHEAQFRKEIEKLKKQYKRH